MSSSAPRFGEFFGLRRNLVLLLVAIVLMGAGEETWMRFVPKYLESLGAAALIIGLYDGVGGVRIALVISIAMGLAGILVQSRIAEDTFGLEPHSAGFREVVKGFDPKLRWLLFSDILVRFCERIPYAWVVIYAMDDVGVSATKVGVLTATEMIVASACYIPVAYLAERYGREPFVIATFFFFTVFPLTLLMAHSFTLLLVAFAVRGLKE